MKRLLHSKTFRNNLGKWLLMYAGIMVLFTTVITYSKYVSSMMTNDSSRVSTFDVSLLAENCTTTDENGYCNVGTRRPTEQIDYYFTLNYNLEVKTDLFFTFYLNNRFSFVEEGIWEVTKNGNQEVLTPVKLSDGTSVHLGKEQLDVQHIVGGDVEGYQTYTKKVMEISAGNKDTKLYKISVRYNKSYCPAGGNCPTTQEDYYKNVTSNMYDILRVGYSATQVVK